MPEGDTVWRTAHRLHLVFAGYELTSCDLRWPSIAEYDFTGARTTEVVSYGKHILHRLRHHDRDWTIHSHLRMDGSWIIEHPDKPVSGYRVRAVLGTTEYIAIGHDLGMLDVVRTADEHILIGHLGPDVLGAKWDPDQAVANLRAQPVPIGAGLLDQRNLAGVGTMWAAEVLFVERVDPWTLTTEMPEAQLRRVVTRVQHLIDVGKEHAIPSSTGEYRAGRTMYVHGRRNGHCRRCGTRIQMAKTGPPTQQRPMWFCPACQHSSGPA